MPEIDELTFAREDNDDVFDRGEPSRDRRVERFSHFERFVGGAEGLELLRGYKRWSAVFSDLLRCNYLLFDCVYVSPDV
jgi:hypothetical protein